MCVLHWIETAGYAQNGCYIILLHCHSGPETGMAMWRVECSNHFAYTQQFLSNAKRILSIHQESDEGLYESQLVKSMDLCESDGAVSKTVAICTWTLEYE